MVNSFVNLPVPSANAHGTAVDVSAMGKTKSLIVGGNFHATLNIEYATDATGQQWAQLATFHGPGHQTIDVAAHWMRASVSAYKSGSGNADVGGADAGSDFVQLPADGSPVAIDDLPLFKTVVVSSGFSGNIEVSADGISWAQVMAFHGGGSRGQSGAFYGSLARIGGGVGGTVWMGGGNPEPGTEEAEEAEQAPYEESEYNQNTRLQRIEESLSGDMLLAILGLNPENVTAVDLNAAAAGTFTRQLNAKLVNAAGAVHEWAAFAPVYVPAEVCVDPDIGPPTILPVAPTFLDGFVNCTVVFDTDGPAGLKTYAAGDSVTVQIKVSATDTLLGWTVAAVTKTYNVI